MASKLPQSLCHQTNAKAANKVNQRLPKEKTTVRCERPLLMKPFIAILVCLLSICLLPVSGVAGNKMQALERLQKLVDNPSEARRMRRKIKNASIKEREQYEELGTIIEKEINTISSSLPRGIDKHTTMDGASIAGNNIAFKYTLSNDMVGIQYKKEVMSEMDTMLKNSFCSSPSGAWLILGYTWSYFYYRENGEYYGGVIIDAKRCGFE